MKNNSTPGAASRRKTVWIALLAALAVAAALGYRTIAGWFAKAAPDYPTFAVAEGPLVISVSENGSIESREKVVVKSQVEGRCAIVSLVKEGTMVKKGDLLVELDSSKFVEGEIEQAIKLQNAEASLIQARETLAISSNAALSEVEKAELDLKFAKIDYKKYLDGEYPMDLQKAEAAIKLAQEELKKAEDQYEWSKKLFEQGYITRTELLTDELAVKRKQIDVDTAQGALDLLKTYTYNRQTEKLQSDAKQAEMALERVQRKARADLVKAEALLRASQSEYSQQSNKLDRIRVQITNCRITAPSDGLVVYASAGSRQWRGNSEPLDVGSEVNEREELLYLPTTTEMNASLKVQESSLTKVKVGMHAVVTVDALPGKVFEGLLTHIDMLPDYSRTWLNPDLKVYNCSVELDTADSGLRPGMSCKVEIIIEEWAKAIYVPVQSVLRINGKTSVYVMEPGGPALRPVEVGLDNNVMIHILSGLTPGEKVWLAPPLEKAAQTERRPTMARGTNRLEKAASDLAPPVQDPGAGGGRPEGRPDRPRGGGRPGGTPGGGRPEGSR